MAVFRFRQHFEQRAQVGVKTHIEHTVGFIDDEKTDVRQVKLTALLKIDHAAGSTDDDVHAFFKRGDLPLVADAAVKTERFQLRSARQFFRFFFNLHRKLACRKQDEHFFARIVRRGKEFL